MKHLFEFFLANNCSAQIQHSCHICAKLLSSSQNRMSSPSKIYISKFNAFLVSVLQETQVQISKIVLLVRINNNNTTIEIIRGN